jgi:23S rRNA (cytosine1962-C5)-methyltransferase
VSSSRAGLSPTGAGLAAQLEQAWAWRAARGLFDESQVLRVFHGPGEGAGELAAVAIDRFGERAWVTAWRPIGAATRAALAEFLRARGLRAASILLRPERGPSELPEPLLGEPSDERFETEERGARFWIQLLGARHPGLFLDHAPLREWLRRRARGLRVLNTFSYTGSLSVAAGLGGAAHVTTLDLAKPVVRWAEENWRLNGLETEAARFIAADYFEQMPRFRRQGERFDLILLDPPSFARGSSGTFSTAKDLVKLHEQAMAVLASGGWLVTSINSANIPAERFETEVARAARAQGRAFQVHHRIDLPESFPTRPGDAEGRYLKGLILHDVGRAADPVTAGGGRPAPSAPPSRGAGAPRKPGSRR